MSARRVTRRVPRPLIATGTAVAALLALTACEKPSPLVAVYSGTTTVHSEAQCYAHDGEEALTAEGCADSTTGVPVLEVRPGDTIGVDVAKDVAEAGWYIRINDQRSDIQRDHYFRFQLGGGDFGNGRLVQLEVVQGDVDKPVRGLWVFTLKRV